MINKLASQTGELSTIRAFLKRCAKYDNQTQPSNSPINLYAVGPPDVQCYAEIRRFTVISLLFGKLYKNRQ